MPLTDQHMCIGYLLCAQLSEVKKKCEFEIPKMHSVQVGREVRGSPWWSPDQ
jgi:hypothetical protein